MIMGLGARQATPNEFPHQVSIQINCHHTCGGSLISDKHVLTAAHCVSDFIKDPNQHSSLRMTVEVGSNHIGGGITHDVKRVSHLNSYNPNKNSPYIFANDVAVITLAHPVTLSRSVQPIEIAREGPAIGDKFIVSGFGKTNNEGSTSPVLNKLRMLNVSPGECQRHWPGKIILGTQICAFLTPGYSVCQGDSGGPLIVKKSDKKYLVGIVSAGTEKCGQGVPDIYTKASAYLPYIEREIAHESTGQGVPDALAIDLYSPNGGSPANGDTKCGPPMGVPPSGPPLQFLPMPQEPPNGLPPMLPDDSVGPRFGFDQPPPPLEGFYPEPPGLFPQQPQNVFPGGAIMYPQQIIG
ncbi:hypothetical protein QAD02_006033 [Eretmocerus hayati]|uniref:Uncharacterized protein n=1 Tax=Eretmocerus hayati TaxID=131215 RepID=A0ACC2N095_9HYME|nr:hypothetical protein QAD02_006033 [Eretmocerus hayati]